MLNNKQRTDAKEMLTWKLLEMKELKSRKEISGKGEVSGSANVVGNIANRKRMEKRMEWSRMNTRVPRITQSQTGLTKSNK